MSGTTRTVQQPLDTHNVLAALGMAAAVLAATVAIAWGSANLARTAPAPLAPPEAISNPAMRDLGARDLGTAPIQVGLTPYGAPGAFRPVVTSGGSSTLVKDDVAIKTQAAQGSLPGFLADKPTTTSGAGAPAIRHPGLRAQ